MKQRKETKQQTIERIWLVYFNDTLFEKGLISEREWHKMKLRIMMR